MSPSPTLLGEEGAHMFQPLPSLVQEEGGHSYHWLVPSMQQHEGFRVKLDSMVHLLILQVENYAS